MKTDDDFLLNCNSMSRSYHKKILLEHEKIAWISQEILL